MSMNSSEITIFDLVFGEVRTDVPIEVVDAIVTSISISCDLPNR